MRRFGTSRIVEKKTLFNSLFRKPPAIRIPQTEDEMMQPMPPLPKRPSKMVEVRRKPGVLGVLSKIFKTDQTGQKTAQKFRQEALPNINLAGEVKFLHTNKITNVLYWYCVDMSFEHSDFARILPDKNLRVGSHDPECDNISFTVTRARNPVNLTRWMGYFLTFDSKKEALVYYQETLGAELCGMPLKLRFVTPSIRGYTSPLLEKVPELHRKCSVLVMGLPVGYSETNILRVLWDYDLIDDDSVAVERVPVERIKYGGSPFLLRFKTEDESERFVRDHNQQVFPYTQNKIICEVID